MSGYGQGLTWPTTAQYRLEATSLPVQEPVTGSQDWEPHDRELAETLWAELEDSIRDHFKTRLAHYRARHSNVTMFIRRSDNEPFLSLKLDKRRVEKDAGNLGTPPYSDVIEEWVRPMMEEYECRVEDTWYSLKQVFSYRVSLIDRNGTQQAAFFSKGSRNAELIRPPPGSLRVGQERLAQLAQELGSQAEGSGAG